MPSLHSEWSQRCGEVCESRLGGAHQVVPRSWRRRRKQKSVMSQESREEYVSIKKGPLVWSKEYAVEWPDNTKQKIDCWTWWSEGRKGSIAIGIKSGWATESRGGREDSEHTPSFRGRLQRRAKTRQEHSADTDWHMLLWFCLLLFLWHLFQHLFSLCGKEVKAEETQGEALEE